ncbi:MAG: hypothetical protein AAFQ62_10775 [Pseudomonadota bacterium]
MSTDVRDTTAQRRAARRSAAILGVVAVAVFVAFITATVLRSGAGA